VLVRSAAPQDREAIRTVVARAFDREDEPKLVERLWAAGATACEVVADDAGEIVGYCACSPVSAAPGVGVRIVGLAPLAVAPERQGRGIGSALVEAALHEVRRDGAGAVVVLGHKDYYPRFGFRPASAKGVRWDVADAGDAFQLIEFKEVFDGAPRNISYHPAFNGV